MHRGTFARLASTENHSTPHWVVHGQHNLAGSEEGLFYTLEADHF